MTEEKRPRAGDWVTYIHPTGSGRKQRPRAHSYRTGRVLERLGDSKLRVKTGCAKDGCQEPLTCRHKITKANVVRVPLDEEHVRGWWPKGSTHAPRNRRPLR